MSYKDDNFEWFPLVFYTMAVGLIGFTIGWLSYDQRGTWKLGLDNVTVGVYNIRRDCNNAKERWIAKLPEKQRERYMKYLTCEEL